MNGYKTNAALKADAREALLGQYNLTITASLVYFLIYSVVIWLVLPAGTTGLFNVLYTQTADIVLQLLTGLFAAGSAYLYLNITYGQQASLTDLFHNFREQPNKALLIQAAFVVISFVSSLPLLIYQLATGGRTHLLIEFALLCAASVIAMLIRLSISQTFYLLQDFPDRDVRELFRASRRLMQGQKMRLFLLTLSFLPLALCCVVTLFLPFLWLRSYYEATLAAFYKDLMSHGKLTHGAGQ